MMAYGYSIKKRNGKKASGKTRKMEPRWLFASLAMAAGIFAYPFGVSEAATEIVRKDGTAIDPSVNVYNIDPEGTKTDFAYNRFQKFSLGSGDIANLQFGGAATLANLVNSKVDINGIVNGIRNGKIDGHLMFLSPEGIAVGATGVINAGQFTGIVPDKTAFDKLYNVENPLTDNTFTLVAINALKDGAYANGKSIDVEGQINTHSGVMLGAGIINIKDGAKIQSTKNLDFKDLVSTGSGLGDLTAVAGTGGDIILTAKQTSDVKDTKTENNAQVPNAIRWNERSTDLNAAVNIGKNVSVSSSDGAVQLTATSTSTYEDSTPMTLTNTLRDAIFGSGETMLDGVIDKLASKEGSANKYLFVNYSNKKNKSAVNIGEGSTITGKNIDIAATSTVQIKQSVAVPSSGKDSEGKTVDNTSAMPVAAVAISCVYNNADVVIDGNLTATGADAEGSGIKISANADTKAELSATAAGGANTSAAVGVAVLSGDTKSKVTVNAPTNAAALTADKGKVSVDATTKSDVDIKVNAVGTNSYVVSNVGVANYDTNADVIVNRSINAGAVDVKAENAVSKLKMTVDNTKASGENQGKNTAEANDGEKAQDEAAANAEKNKPDSEKSEDEKKSEKKSIDPTKVVKDANVDTNDNKTKDAAGTDGKGGVQDVVDKVNGTNNGGDNAKQNSAFGLGASVGVVSNKNDAKVTIGKDAVITASKPDGALAAVDGSVKVNADTLMTASADKEDVLHFTVKNTQANANAEIGAAVLVSNVKNAATVLLDGDGTKSAQITGTGAVSLDAKAGMGTYKVTQKKKDENGNELQETEEVDKTSTLSYTVSAEGTAQDDHPSKFALDGSVGVNTLKNNATVLLGQNSKVTGSAVKLSSDTAAGAEGTYGATDDNATVGLGATVGIQNIRDNSLVMDGKGVQLTGTESLEASANNSMDLKNSVQNAGKGDSVGVSGMVALSYGDSNSIVSIDDEAAVAAPTVTVTSMNSTNIDNSARSESTGHEGAKAFGIGVGIVNYDVNSLAMVADNGKGITAPSAGTTDAEKAAKKIYEDAALAQKIAGDTLAGKLGDKTAVGAKGGITTADLDLSATTTGMLKNDAKAKAVSSSQDDGDENSRKDSEKWTNWSKQGKSGADEARTDARNLEQDNVTSQNGSAAPSASGAAQEAGSAANPDETPTAPPDNAAPAAGSSGSAGASIGMEGSAALTFLGGRTDAVLDNVTVKSGTDPASLAGLVDSISVDVSATDFLGSITLGGTTTKNSLKEGGSATKVGIGGTFAMNSTNRDVDSFVRNSDIQKAGFLSNSASKIGIEVAAGMGLSTGAGNGANVNGAGVVYYNKAKQDVHALLINNTVTSDFLGNVLGLGMLSNEAVSTDFQIAGGLAATSGSGSGTNVGVGGAVAVSRLENDLASGVIGGSYTNFATIDVEAQKGTTQINGAAAGAKSGYGFNGAFAYGSTKNKTHAYISDNATVGGVLTGEVNVKAGEVPVVKTQETLDQENTQLSSDKTKVENNSILTTNAKKRLKNSLTEDVNASKKNAEQAGANKTTLTDAGIDPTGKDYLVDGSEESSLDNAAAGTDAGAAADEAAGDENEAKGLLGQNHSVTITAAMAGGLSSDVGAGAGIAYNYVKNDIAADIKDSTITADSINGEASSDSLIVSVGAGVAVGGKTFNGAGSGSWNDLKNDTKVTFADNTINGNKISAQADNASSIINIAGEVAGGKGMAMGLSLAYNSLNNTTGAYLTGNDIDMKNLTGLLEDSNSVKLASSNTGKALAVAGGVDVSIDQSNVGAVGTVAINRGVNHTESVIDGKTSGENTTLDNLKSLVVAAEDVTKKTTVAGGISVGGSKVGVGGAVAYTSVGSSNNKERLRAEINNADVTTTETGVISVSTADSKTTTENNTTTTEKSRITTVGAGIGVGWGKNYFNLQGAAAVSDIYKDSFASLNNTNINATEEDKNNHPTIDVTADTKSKINTVGAVGNISVNGKVTGTAGVAINRINQDTKAEMATKDGKTTTVNAGRTEVRAAGDADIHSVGVGGTVSVNEYVAFAGSGSYNYIDNDVNAIIKNQNLTSTNNVGVVAQSDDRLYNFAGGFSIGANTKAGIGAAVGINKITSSTNALVSGGSVVASGSDVASDAITVSRPQDADLYKAESLDVKTNTQKLSDHRQTESKTGIVVDSSATHTLISQMSSGGVAASASVGVNLAGTVNLNTIEGSTTAKIQNAALNTAEKYSNINVNAVDYTNLGTFTGTPSVGAAATAGVSVGVSADWETLDRTTTAEISATSADAKKGLHAKNLTVDATAKHGSSTLSFAAAAGAAATAGVASGDSIVRHKNTSETTALLKNMDAVFDGAANIRATHLGNSHTQNISASAAGGYAAVAAGAGVSVMDDTSTVKAEVDGSNLKAKDKTTQDVSVLATNENTWKETLVTASLAVGLGAGLAANVGIHNTTGETAALVTNSQLEAHDVTVNATDKLTATNTGGVGAAGVGGVGVSVALNNINSSVSAQVSGGSVTASNNIDVKAEEERSFDSSVTGVAVGGLGVGVNVAVTSVGKGITQAQLSSVATDEKGNSVDAATTTQNVNTTTQNEINLHLNGNGSNYGGVNGAKGALGVSGAKFAGLSSKDSDLSAARNTTVSLNVAKEKTDKQGVHTSVKEAALTAAGDVNVKAQEQSDVKEKNVTVTVGGAAVGVTDAIIHKNYDTDVTMTGATVTGKNVTVEALQGQKNNGSEINVTAVSVGAGLGVGVGYAGIVNNGATDVNISGSTIKSTAGNVTVNAKDDSKSKTDITNVGVSALNVTTTFASVENNANVGVALGGTNNISADNNVTIDATKANALEAHTSGVGVGGVAVAVNHATIEDEGKAAAKITGTTNVAASDGKSSAEKFHLGATNNTTGNLSAGNVTVSILGVSRMRGKGVMDMGAEVGVAGGSFNAKTAEFASLLGDSKNRTLEGNVKGHNISVGVAVAPDAVVLNTTATGTVDVKNSTFGENTDLILDNESHVDRKAYIYDVTAGAVAVGNSSADVYGKETLTTTLAGKSGTANKLNSVQVATYGENTGKAFADAGGGGLVGYVGAHVRNDSINNVTSSLSGTWETAGDVWLVAAQSDEAKLTASEGHGGVIGVGGTSAENYITTTTNADVAGGTVINADRVHIGTSNVVATGAYDDTDNKGNKDVQTYTLKDHFGGAISGNRLRSLVNLKETGNVNIGANAKITTNGLQEYIAGSQNDLTNLVQAKGGAAVAVTDAVSELDLDIHNNVNVGSGALLTNEKAASTEDVILSAYDNQNLKSHVDATTGAAAAVIVAKNNIDMDRTSAVNVAGTIESGAKVGLYAGAKKDGALSNLNADLKSGAYNYSAVPVAIPRVNYTITADKGNVDVSGVVRSTGDINVIASGGMEEVVKDESVWNWAKGGSSTDKKFLTSDATTAEESLPKKSTVSVTGSLIAGTSEPIELTIDGSVAGGLEITAPNNRANNRVMAGVTQGTFDYANTLGARLTELNNLIASYDGDAGKMAAYIAERDRIQQEMVKQGLVERDENGNIVQYLNSGRSVYYVEIPDISASGGNINVQANDFVGSGKLHANSAPSVTITNNSDAYLKLNNIIMGEKGGQIVYNKDNVIPPGASLGNPAINNINVSKSGARFSEIYGVTSGEAAALKVLNTKTFSGNDRTSTISLTLELEKEINSSDMTAQEKEDTIKAIKKGEMTYTAIPDVEVNGKVSNFYGQVEINNASGNIRISGGTKDRPTGVEGNTVKLIAGNGTIAQDYKEGIVNINGDPEKYLVDTANALKNANALRTDANDTKSASQTYTRSDSSQEATGYIAGRDVYVSAANVNVNGLIQSGYKDYYATVTDEDLAEAQKMSADRAAVVQNRTMYKVNQGGATWNEGSKVFDYVAQVYWDPSTKQLFVENIDTAGGKVYLTGKIASTGQGRILAADGAAIITVTNNTALDMNVGQVLNNQREGVITIADTANDSWTEYRKGQTRTIQPGYDASDETKGYAAYLKEHAADGDPYAGATKTDNNLSVGTTLDYAVKGGQVYSWVNGKSVETTATYQHYERRGFWGLVQTADETTLNGWTTDSNRIEPMKLKELGLPDGAIISQGSNAAPNANTLYYNANNDVKSSRTFGRDHWVTRSGFLGWFKHIYDRWKVGTSSIQLYNYSLNASQPITIGLIGDATGKIDIKSTNTTGGSINLTGNVANSHNLAQLNVSSAAGKITQFDNTTLKSEIVNLTAKDDISNIHLASIGSKDANGNVTDNIQLTAVSNGAGDIDVTAVGGLLNNQSLPGNVEIKALKSQNGNAAFASNAALGDVTLNASGNITQSGTGVTVEGRGINLTSKNGGIGTSDKAINILGSDYVYSTDRYGAQVNASAEKSIYLTEAAAGDDMRVGKIESKSGDVTLTVANGGFIDGLPRDDTSGSNDSVDEMVHRWIDAGLIDGEKDAQGNYTYKGAYIEGLEKARDDYKVNVEAAYENYKKNVAAANEVKADYASADYQNYLNKAGDYAGKTDEEIAAKLAADDHQKYAYYKQYATAEEYLTANNMNWEAQYNTQKAAVEAIYNSAEYSTYLANKAKYDALSLEERQKLADSGNSAFKAYVNSAVKYSQYADYATADAYMQNTASYKYSQFSHYENADNYLAADATYQDLVAKAANPTYEWTKEMMLYAVSDALVNPASGSSTQTDGPANVLGRNVTLTSTQGAVGNISDTSTTITVEELTGENKIEKMKKLMSVGAADVKVKRDDSGDLTEFVITPNMPLGVKASGTLDVQAGGNVSVAGRTDTAGEHSAINVGTINATTAGDVRLYSDKGIYNALDGANGVNITGHDLLLKGGKESIGEAEKPLTVSLTGDLTEAQADKNVFIKNMKQDDVLRLGAMYAADTISLTSEKGFLMSGANASIADSFINAGKKLEFNTNAETGIVGDADHAIRILNDRAPVDITAKSAYIKGMDSLSLGVRNGTLTLGTVTTKGEFVAESDGSLTVGREEEKNGAGTVVKEAVNGSINAAGNVTLAAKDDLTLDGAVTSGDLENTPKTLTLTATNGSIAQTDKGVITADEVKTFNGKSLLLENTGNQFNSIVVDGITTAEGETPAIAGDVRVKDNSDALTVAVNRSVTGGISVQNLRADGILTNDGNLTATGNISLGAKGDLTQAAGTTLSVGEGKEVTLTSTEGAVAQADDTTGIAAKNVTVTSATGVDLQGAGNAFDAITVQSADATQRIAGDVAIVDSAEKLTISGRQAAANGEISGIAATGNIAVTNSDGDVFINSDVSTGNTEPPSLPDLVNPTQYNSLSITADGAIQEAVGVKIETPVVATHSGKGVSLESEKNDFAVFRADALADSTAIDGSVKVKTDSSDEEDGFFTVGLGASVLGDAEFTNLAQDGSLGILATNNNGIVDVQGGNGAEGNLVLNAQKNVGLLGDVHAAKDIVIESKNGEFFGAGNGMAADNDVNVSAGNAVNYIGTIEAENNINIKVTAPSTEDSGIYIGPLTNPSTGNTSLTAGNEARFDVQGNGNIVLGGGIVAEAGDVAANISGAGSVFITGSVESENQSVSVETGEGHIIIGTVNYNEETVKAKQDITVGTGTGTITIQGKTSTATGDITMKAGQDVYEAGMEHGNFIIANDGALISGGEITLSGRNGDVVITDDMQAQKGITVNIAEEGNASFGRDVTVTNDVNISTDKGTIAVGHTVNAQEGTVSLKTGAGDILVGKDVTAGQGVAISSHEGDIVVGDVDTGDDGDVLAKTGNVSIRTDEGNIGIVKTVTAQEGSVGISSGQGDILIGNNGPDVKTVTAKENIDLAASDGKVVVYGKTSTEEGDISVSARKNSYVPGEDNRSFIIDQNGKLEAGRAIHLNVGNGDLHVSDRIQANEDLVAELEEKGSIYFDTDVNVAGNVSVKTADGDINVGHEVQASKDIAMTTNTGNITVGAGVVSTGGDVNLAANRGDISIGKEVRSDTGNVGVRVGTGSVTIGDNGPDVETLTARDNINVDVDLGKVMIYGKTSTQTGDISMSAGDSHYTPGVQNIVIGLNGEVDSGRDVNLQGRNGDLHVTDAIQTRRNLTAQVSDGGGVFFEQTATLPGNLSLAGNFIIAEGVTAQTNGTVFQFSAMGALPQKLISEDFYVGSLRSPYGTEMPSLWTNRGYLHVDEGNIAVKDVLAVDKIYLDNELTDIAVFGRTPTRDGEQLVYWNNLEMAYSKERAFQLYTDGMLRTSRAILIDADRNYTKLYGDNLSVVDMMRERVTNEHGQYTFDSASLTEPGRLMREPVFFGMESTDVIIRQQSAPDAEIVIE